MRNTLTLLAIFFSLVFVNAQSAMLKKADHYYDTYAFVKASEAYNAYIANKKNNAKDATILRGANAYYFIGDSKNASKLYEKIYVKDSTLVEPFLSRYVRSLRQNKDYETAHQVHLNHLKAQGNKDNIYNYLAEYNAFQELLSSEDEPTYTLKNVAANSKYSDFAPVAYNDKLIFTSSRPGNAKQIYSWNEQPYLSLIIAEIDEAFDLDNAQLFSEDSKTNYHDATIALVPDSNTIYFTSNNVEDNKLILDDNRKNHFKLFKGALVGNTIKNRIELPFNSDKYSVGHPSVSADGKYLFFASDMPGGYGESDIYFCIIFEDGTHSKPQNAGAKINTTGNDFFPHIYEGNLYYASNGHLGFGGLDVFESSFDRQNESFTRVTNLGKGINTNYDDFSILFMGDGSMGYVASNRPGGKGDDDIYQFNKKPKTCFQDLVGNVKDKKSQQNLEDVLITVKDSSNTVITSIKTDIEGNYNIVLPCNVEVTLIASKDDYFEQVKIGITNDIDGEQAPAVNFELEKPEDLIVVDEVTKQEKIDLDPIYFDFDKWDITPQAAEVLYNAVRLINFYPEMVIKIEAHTDSRGSDEYNFKLSDKRAKSTQQYLYSQGIPEDRILSAQGYGERRLLNTCFNGVTCTEEQHDVNRRSDFIILKR